MAEYAMEANAEADRRAISSRSEAQLAVLRELCSLIQKQTEILKHQEVLLETLVDEMRPG